MFHGGGLIVGSSEAIPLPQTGYLASHGFVVVAPNYRLCPQVTAEEAFADCCDAYAWATTTLPEHLQATLVDTSRVVAMGHSSGGTLALHIGSTCANVAAVTAFYPSLYFADTSTSAHQPTTAPPFGIMPDFVPSDEDWKLIKPDDKQISEVAMPVPGSVPPPRSRWQGHALKHGQWPSILQPDGNYEAIDPFTRLNASWPPVMLVQGDADRLPGSGMALVQRAVDEMKAAGVSEVELEVIEGESHMFDLPPTIGRSDVGPKWQAVVKGLDWLCSHVQDCRL